MKKKKSKMLYFFIGFSLAFAYMIGCQTDRLLRPFLFHPTGDSVGDWKAMSEMFEEVQFKNSRDEFLNGRYFSYGELVPGDSARGSILYCHGNGGNVTDYTSTALELCHDLRCNVLLFDYAGYGKSEGRPTATGILDDGRAARNWLAQRDGIRSDQVIVYGFSLGGSVVTDIAAVDGARALIIESSFTSLGDMARRKVPFLPFNWLLRERLASVEKIGNFHGPVFISHGKRDGLIPFSQGERLFSVANEPKTFYIPRSPNYDWHSAPLSREHLERLRRFIDEVVEEPDAQRSRASG